MQRAGWAAVALAGVIGAWVLASTYAFTSTSTGIVDGLTTLLPVPVALTCGLCCRRSIGLAACIWMALTIELNQGYVNPFVLVVVLVPWFIGVIIRDRRRLTRRLAEVGEELEMEVKRVADEAVIVERARVARELHDIVAHCVSVMVVQAYAGERLAPTDAGLAAEAFGHIANAAGQAKLEIASLIDLLADEDERPSRGLRAELEDLVAGTQVVGLDIQLRLAGDLDMVPPTSAAVAYRVVQESLTNALKHSPGAPVAISVDCGSDVVIDVINAASERTDAPLAHSGGGRGLNGIRDRVCDLGGTFDAGPDFPGAWRVSVRFPNR